MLKVNACPFLVVQAATEPGDDGWSLRAEELRAEWETFQGAAPGPEKPAPLWPKQAANSPLARFGLELQHALTSLRPPWTGIILVLAPVWVRDAKRWSEDLAALFETKRLAQARFVVVEADEASSLPVMEKLGAAVERVDARIDDAALREEMDARMEAMKNAPPGVTGPRRIGAAGPSVAPPPRKDQPPPLSAEQREATAKKLGVPVAMLDLDAMHGLQVLVLSAAAAMRDQDATRAVRLQREARDYCIDRGLERESVVNELVLAGYVLQGGSPENALKVFRDARNRAEAAQLAEMAVQAQLAVGSCLMVMKRADEAATAYAEAGNLGVSANAPVLAIEAFRMCGQLLVSRGQLEDGAKAFRRALETAEEAGADAKKNSSAIEAARALAAICRKRGLVQQAESLEAQAAAIEQSFSNPTPNPPSSPPPS
jgi:tetratricopeptide (TPR) repeat protein